MTCSRFVLLLISLISQWLLARAMSTTTWSFEASGSFSPVNASTSMFLEPPTTTGATLCGKPPSPETIICGTNNTEQVMCWVEKLYPLFGDVSDPPWLVTCTFIVPPEITDFTNYGCNVTPNSGQVHCFSNGKAPFGANCIFSLFHCNRSGLAACHDIMYEAFQDGGQCAAEDEWCPNERLYSLTKYIFKGGETAVFADLLPVNLRAAAHCTTWKGWMTALLVIGVLGIVVGILFALRLAKSRYNKFFHPHQMLDLDPALKYLDLILMSEVSDEPPGQDTEAAEKYCELKISVPENNLMLTSADSLPGRHPETMANGLFSTTDDCLGPSEAMSRSRDVSTFSADTTAGSAMESDFGSACPPSLQRRCDDTAPSDSGERYQFGTPVRQNVPVVQVEESTPRKLRRSVDNPSYMTREAFCCAIANDESEKGANDDCNENNIVLSYCDPSPSPSASVDNPSYKGKFFFDSANSSSPDS